MFNGDIPMYIIIASGMTYSILAKKLTLMAAFTGGLLAFIIYSASGYPGLAMMSTFFILGSAATTWHQSIKKACVHQKETEKCRNVWQVLANAGAAAIAGIIILFFPQLNYFMFPAIAAAFASATSDTLSSELGMVYGKRFFNIISFKPDHCGMDGVISLEGTLIGIAGSCIISIIYAFGWGWDISFLLIVLAGTLGNLTDSVLGALLERKAIVGNNGVNFLNTLAAMLVMLLMGRLLL